MKPILIIGPGTSLLHYAVEPTAGRVVVTCPVCGASATALEASRRHMTTMLEHEPDCEWLANVERLATINRKDAHDEPVH
jgi:hypothetical protein